MQPALQQQLDYLTDQLTDLLQNTTICYYNSRQLGLSQLTTACYYNLRSLGLYISRQLLLQFTTGIRRITIHARTFHHLQLCSFALNSFSSFSYLNVVMSSKTYGVAYEKLKKGSSMLLFKHCSTIFADCVIFLITSFEILILVHGLRGELY